MLEKHQIKKLIHDFQKYTAEPEIWSGMTNYITRQFWKLTFTVKY